MSTRRKVTKRKSRAFGGAVAAAGLGVLTSTLGVPSAAALPGPVGANPWEVAVCATSATKCTLTYSSSTAAKNDALSRPGRLAPEGGWPPDGTRDNAFMHSSWNARAAVVTRDRSWVYLMTTAHEQPLTSGNPPGTNLTNRHERMDLCNNLYGSNKPSNTEQWFLDQMTSVNSLWNMSRAMQEDGGTPEAMLSNDTCSGIRLYFIRKNNGAYFG